MSELTKEELHLVQVIQELPEGKMRIFTIEDMHLGDDNDPLTTIRLTGEYKDVWA